MASQFKNDFNELETNDTINEFDDEESNWPTNYESLQECECSLSSKMDDIINLVPQKDCFYLALNVIKIWAKKKNIYNKLLGFLEDISLGILVARICQLFPNSRPKIIINKFFLIYSQWKWPQPVSLKKHDNNKISRFNTNCKVWDPCANYQDKFDLMPIITPEYPQHNSASNVTLSSRDIILLEFKNGFETTNKILNKIDILYSLFTPSDFFTIYNQYIVVITKASCNKNILEWNSFVESKIRFFVLSLEQIKPQVLLTHIHTKSIKFKNEIGEENKWFIGLKFSKLEIFNINLTDHVQKFTTDVYSKAISTGIYKEDMILEVRHARKKDLKHLLPVDIFNNELKPKHGIKRKMSSISISSLDVDKINNQDSNIHPKRIKLVHHLNDLMEKLEIT